MLTKEKVEALKPLLEDESFGNELCQAATDEDILAIFTEHGITVSKEDLDELATHFPTEKQGELDEQSLENVSGGFAISGLVIYGVTIAVAYGIGKVFGRRARKLTC